MVSINPFSYLPRPPDVYDQRYFSEVIKAFSVFITQVSNPGVGRHTELTLTNLQTNDSELELGAIFNVDGVLHISVSERPYVAGMSVTCYCGSVTTT